MLVAVGLFDIFRLWLVWKVGFITTMQGGGRRIPRRSHDIVLLLPVNCPPVRIYKFNVFSMVNSKILTTQCALL